VAADADCGTGGAGGGFGGAGDGADETRGEGGGAGAVEWVGGGGSAEEPREEGAKVRAGWLEAGVHEGAVVGGRGILGPVTCPVSLAPEGSVAEARVWGIPNSASSLVCVCVWVEVGVRVGGWVGVWVGGTRTHPFAHILVSWPQFCHANGPTAIHTHTHTHTHTNLSRKRANCNKT
jgi:hypothetical protein